MLFDSLQAPFLVGLAVFLAIQLIPWVWVPRRPVQDKNGLATDAIFQASHPFPCWRVDQFGVVKWANNAADNIGTPFQYQAFKQHFHDPQSARHVIASDADGASTSYDVFATALENGTYFSAFPTDTDSKGTDAQKTAIRTLANTFSHLSTGLAIFSADRSLTTFNPALLDLTGFKFETLSRGTDVLSFLDKMRDSGFLFEPRDYQSWRKDFENLHSAPSGTDIMESWTLADGRTLRMTAKAQADHSVALLLEDVTLNTDAIRELREDLFVLERMLDNSNVPQITFDLMGRIVHANGPYKAFWNHDPEEDEIKPNLHRCCRMWQMKSNLDANWATLARLGAHLSRGKQQSFRIECEGRAPFDVQCTVLSGQITAVSFIEDRGIRPNVLKPAQEFKMRA